jgi:hypothetical protein
MKSLIILTTLYLMTVFCLESTNAQVPPKMSYNLISESPTISLSNRDNSFSQNNNLCLFRMTSLTSLWTDIKYMPNSVSLSKNRNYNELIIKPVLFYDNDIRLIGKSSSMSGSGNRVTFNGKWESLTGKPIIDPSRVYNSPLKRTNNPTFSDNHFYRSTANIFNFVMDAKYPSSYMHK